VVRESTAVTAGRFLFNPPPSFFFGGLLLSSFWPAAPQESFQTSPSGLRAAKLTCPHFCSLLVSFGGANVFPQPPKPLSTRDYDGYVSRPPSPGSLYGGLKSIFVSFLSRTGKCPPYFSTFSFCQGNRLGPFLCARTHPLPFFFFVRSPFRICFF